MRGIRDNMADIKEKIKGNHFLYVLLHSVWIAMHRIPVKFQGNLRSHGIGLNDNYRRLASYKNIHKGERCFIVANGPSLTAEDLDMIKDEYSIGCNKIYYVFNKTQWRPTYYCILDIDYVRRYQDEIFANIEMPVFTNNQVEKHIKANNKKGKTIIYSQQIYYNNFVAWPDLLRYTYGTKQGTIMSYVMAVAIYMGFSEIYILGMDNNSTIAGNHFSGYKEDKLLEKNLERRMKENGWDANHWKNQTDVEMGEFKKYADINNIRIYNATRGGKLEVFPRKSLNECI